MVHLFSAYILACFLPLYYTYGMQGNKYTLWLGLWLLLVAFLSIPSSWKEGLFILTGILLLALSLIGLRQKMRSAAGEEKEPAAPVEPPPAPLEKEETR